MPGHVSVETLTPDERDSQITMTINCLFDTWQGHDGMLRSDMEPGVGESYNRLEAEDA